MTKIIPSKDIGVFYSSPSIRSTRTAEIALGLNNRKDEIGTECHDVEDVISNYLERLKYRKEVSRAVYDGDSRLKVDERFEDFSFGQLEGISVKDMRFVEKDIIFQLYYMDHSGFTMENLKGKTSKTRNWCIIE